MDYYSQGYKAGYTHGFWIGAVAGIFGTLALCLLVGFYIP